MVVIGACIHFEAVAHLANVHAFGWFPSLLAYIVPFLSLGFELQGLLSFFLFSRFLTLTFCIFTSHWPTQASAIACPIADYGLIATARMGKSRTSCILKNNREVMSCVVSLVACRTEELTDVADVMGCGDPSRLISLGIFISFIVAGYG